MLLLAVLFRAASGFCAGTHRDLPKEPSGRVEVADVHDDFGRQSSLFRETPALELGLTLDGQDAEKLVAHVAVNVRAASAQDVVLVHAKRVLHDRR